jgi:hypothetical protein
MRANHPKSSEIVLRVARGFLQFSFPFLCRQAQLPLVLEKNREDVVFFRFPVCFESAELNHRRRENL